MTNHKFPYDWQLKNGYPSVGIEKNDLNVFGTFICGGGSSMGYKLAGFNHLGGVEIDPKIAKCYEINHKPKHLFIEDIRLFNKREDLPKELYNLAILDGSPPCSSFSMSGKREKDWGKEKQFAEGQALQRLDDLVFEYVRTIKKLQPKVAIFENVKGLIQGNAKSYAKKIQREFEAAGYRVQLFLLNAASMGVPQKRERVFFIGLRKDFDLPLLKLNFSEKPINFGQIVNISKKKDYLTENYKPYWEWCKKNKCADYGKYNEMTKGKRGNFGNRLIFNSSVCDTIITSKGLTTENEPRYLTDSEYIQVGTYPSDYNFLNVSPQYLIAMSVPPVMVAQIAHQIYLQWFSRI